MNLLHEGKAKEVYLSDEPDKVVIHFKDALTAFNAQKKAQETGKGALACDISVKLFHFLEQEGIKTHFLARLSETSILAQRVDILPLEVIVRFLAAGSLCRRYGVAKGKPLEPPVVEFSLKDDALGDPLMCPSHILSLGLASEDTLLAIESTSLEAAGRLRDLFAGKGLSLVDIKFEFGTNRGGELLLADEISPDTMRLWTQEGESLDKDIFREDKGDLLAAYREVQGRLS